MSQDFQLNERARIAILISGRGSNMVALAEAVRDGRIKNAKIAVVISDQRNALGLARANAIGIETLVIGRRGRTREEHDHEIVAALRSRKVDLVCLAGYMRVLSREFVDETLDGGRILRQSEDVDIQADDTVETLSDRILIEEHKLYPEVVSLVLENMAEKSTDG